MVVNVSRLCRKCRRDRLWLYLDDTYDTVTIIWKLGWNEFIFSSQPSYRKLVNGTDLLNQTYERDFSWDDIIFIS